MTTQVSYIAYDPLRVHLLCSKSKDHPTRIIFMDMDMQSTSRGEIRLRLVGTLIDIVQVIKVFELFRGKKKTGWSKATTLSLAWGSINPIANVVLQWEEWWLWEGMRWTTTRDEIDVDRREPKAKSLIREKANLAEKWGFTVRIGNFWVTTNALTRYSGTNLPQDLLILPRSFSRPVLSTTLRLANIHRDMQPSMMEDPPCGRADVGSFRRCEITSSLPQRIDLESIQV